MLFQCVNLVFLAAASLTGSPASQMRQNRAIDAIPLERMADITELKSLAAQGKLVPIADTEWYAVDVTLGVEDPTNAAWYAHARPWVKAFLDDLRDAPRRAGERFRITSLSRTAEYQRLLVGNSGENPTAIRGRKWWQRSSHLAGATVDITYKEMSYATRKWLQARLLDLERRKLIEATKERKRSTTFHIMVFPGYRKTRP